MAAVWYRWADKAKPDLCERTDKVFPFDQLCYHCGKVIPAGSQVVCLLTDRSEWYTLHNTCAEKSCTPSNREHSRRVDSGDGCGRFGEGGL